MLSFLPFGTGPTIGASGLVNLNREGNRDAQYRPFELCTCSYNDGSPLGDCEEPTFGFDPTTRLSEKDGWPSGFKYQNPDEAGTIADKWQTGGLFGLIQYLGTSFLNGILGVLDLHLFGLSFSFQGGLTVELINVDQAYNLDEPPQYDVIGFIEGATQGGRVEYTDANGNTKYYYTNETCIEPEARSVSWDCNDSDNNPDNHFRCDASCTETRPDPDDPTVTQTRGCSSSNCDGWTGSPPPDPDGWVMDCSWTIYDQYTPYGYDGAGNPTFDPRCIGDLETKYTATYAIQKNSTFTSDDFTVTLGVVSSLLPPFQEIQNCKTGNTVDHDLTSQKTDYLSTEGHKREGRSGTGCLTNQFLPGVSNPQFIEWAPAPATVGQLPSSPRPGGPGSNGGPSGSSNGDPRCAPLTTGFCTVENLNNPGMYFPNAEEAYKAAVVCRRESGGGPRALNDHCTYWNDGDPTNDSQASFDYSVGLFQLNILTTAGGRTSCILARNFGNELINVIRARDPSFTVPTNTHHYPDYSDSALFGAPVTRGCPLIEDLPPTVQEGINNCRYLLQQPEINTAVAAHQKAGCRSGGTCSWGAWSGASYCNIQ